MSARRHGLNAVVVGATGATGKAVVAELVRNENWASVRTVGRRQVDPKVFFGDDDEALQTASRKLSQHTADLGDLQGHIHLFEDCDVCICCLGTTLKAAGSKEAQYKVDVAYPLEAARVAKEAGVRHYSIVTAQGSDPNSWFFYPRIKGEVEEKVKALGLERTSIFRPGLLLTKREESRPFEYVAQVVGSVLDPFMRGPLRSARAIKVETVARAIRFDAERSTGPKVVAFNNAAIQRISDSGVVEP